MSNKGIIQIALNVLFVVAIGVLAYLHFSKSTKIAFIKSSEVLSKYQGMIDAREAYKGKSVVWQANIDTLSKELEKSIQDYTKAKATMTDKEKKLSEELLQSKQRQMLQYQEGIKQKAQMEDQTLTKDVLEKVNQYLKKYGEDNGYTIIFAANETGNIVHGDEAIDLTNTIIEGLNKEYKK